MLRIAVFLATLAAPALAAAESDPKGAGFFLELEGSTVVDVDHGAHRPDLDDVTLVSAHAMLATGSPRLRYRFALDLGLGATLGGYGGAYDVQVLPIGVAFELREPEHALLVGFGTGIGGSGAVSSLPAAWSLPVQVQVIARLTPELNLLGRGRVSYLINDTGRSGGAPSGLGDELDATLAIQKRSHFDNNYLAGYYAGIAYRELEHAHFVGVVIGWGGGEEAWSGVE